ncbi:MAG: hypothetical protein V4620_13675 [Bacteroidota bacterium]
MKRIIAVILFLTILVSSCSSQTEQEVSKTNTSVYKIKPDTLIQGYKDQNGLKQGSFYTYNSNKTVNFIRTYKNDTLNGFLGCYNPNGYINSEQFYKNGKPDGIYFEYEGANKIVSKGYYKEGLKHGVFIEFHENGNLKYEGFFQNDVLVGDEIHYYPNKVIRSIGNTESGNYQYFDNAGNLKRNIEYEKGVITRTQIYCSDSLKKLPHTFIKPKALQTKDIKNTSTLKVEELYSNYQTTSNEMDFIEGASITWVDSSLAIRFDRFIYFIKANGLYRCKDCADYDSKYNMPVSTFGTNREMFTNEKNEEDIRYFERDETVPSKKYKITVHRQQLQCDDTGNNPLTIEYKGKTLSIANLKNIQIFEYDSDKNGQNEIYIISYMSCEGHYKILKIS